MALGGHLKWDWEAETNMYMYMCMHMHHENLLICFKRNGGRRQGSKLDVFYSASICILGSETMYKFSVLLTKTTTKPFLISKRQKQNES